MILGEGNLMLSSAGVPYYYIHIPKTAGTAITRALGTPKHNHHISLLWRDVVGQECWDQSFTFAFVRNPWDMIVSWFYYHKLQNFAYQSISFEDWILDGMVTHWEVNKKRDWHEQYHSNDPLNQLLYITDESGDIMVDFVGRFERLQEDFSKVCLELSVPPSDLQKNNGSTHDHYRQYYTAETRDVVARRFADVIETFDYEY